MLTHTADMCERRELGCQLARVLHFIFGTAAGTKVAQGFCDYVDGTRKKINCDDYKENTKIHSDLVRLLKHLTLDCVCLRLLTLFLKN